MPKYTTAALLAVLMLVCTVILCGRPMIQKEEEPETTVEKTAIEAPQEPAEPPFIWVPEEENPAPREIVNTARRIRASLAEVIAVNFDAVGWIYVPGTDIDYCIVLGEDNDFYLDHNELRDYSALGAIFEDYEDQRRVEDNRNTVLYGHNVWYGGMFHDVEKYLEEDYFKLKTPIYYYTMDKVFVFEPFTIFEADWGYQYFAIDFKDEEEYVSFLYEMRDNSKFPRDIEFTAEDKILTFSTCTNGEKTRRWCFQSYLIETYDLPAWRPHANKNERFAPLGDMTVRSLVK